ncbi:MAG: ATP-dependent zinc metalloprotease FtsH, partial [Clostridia bacterium]|nr:ATP-dependent zinc metalloprotease FtsH [Clostridia bacterium]
QDPVHQISIIPRGMAGGYTMHLPSEDRSYQSRNEMKEELIVLLGGRVAEALVLGDISTGASNDIERASKITRSMVTKYDMSDNLGPITYGTDGSNPFLGKEMGHVSNYSEITASAIDNEVREIITEAYRKSEKILSDHMDLLHRLAAVLFEREKLDADEFVGVIEGTLLPAAAAQSETAADFAAEMAGETEKQETENQE